MKILKFLPLFTLFFLCINCSKSETPTTTPDLEIDGDKEAMEPITPQEPIAETYFSLSVDESKDTSITDDWVLIHDSNGNVLDFKSFETGDQIEFKDLDNHLTNQINISFFSFTSAANNFFPSDNYIVNTYNKIEKGSTWVYKENEIPNYYSTSNGEFSVEIENVPLEFAGKSNFSVSNARINSSHTSSSTNDFNNTKTVTKGIRLYPDNDYFVTVEKEDLEFKYVFIDDAQPNQNYNLDYNNLLEFDSYIIIDLPNGSSFRHTVRGFEDGQSFNEGVGYLLNSNDFISFGKTGNQIKLGYLNSFSNFLTDIFLGTNQGIYGRRIYGPKPENLIIPNDISINVQNSSITEFNYYSNLSFTRKSNTWRGGDNSDPANSFAIQWTIHSPKSDFFGDLSLPEELTNEYPNLKIDNLNLDDSTFYTESDSYEEHIKNTFENPIYNVFSFERIILDN